MATHTAISRKEHHEHMKSRKLTDWIKPEKKEENDGSATSRS